MIDRVGLWNRCDLFNGLTADEVQRLQRRSRRRRFRKGEIIYFPTEPAESVLFVLQGRVVLKDITADGREKILAFIEAGEMFGELALLDASGRNEYAEAVSDVQILSISRDDLLWLIEHRADVALEITRLFASRRRQFENRLRNVLFRSKREQVCSLLLELLDLYGEPVVARSPDRATDGAGSGDPRTTWEIRLRLSHQELANLIGATRETVTVVLGELQLDGLIEVGRRQIIILNRDGLAAEADGRLATA